MMRWIDHLRSRAREEAGYYAAVHTRVLTRAAPRFSGKR